MVSAFSFSHFPFSRKDFVQSSQPDIIDVVFFSLLFFTEVGIFLHGGRALTFGGLVVTGGF